jgi:hypothetical protein
MVTPINEDFFYQRPHHNLFNKIYFSDFMKRYNPLHEWRSPHPYYHVRMAKWYGKAPQATWVDGSIDYTYNKYNQNTIGHFHLHENRKNKPFKRRDGGDKIPEFAQKPLYPTYAYEYYPKGCGKEVNKYKRCVSDKKDASKCIDQKINIMEICPKWVLEALRERKKVLMRATLIDNETYRRAMKVSEYNKHRSLRDIKADVKGERNIRGDGYLSDDRYNPTKYPSPDHNTNVNLGNQIIYNDILGGNKIENINSERKVFSTNTYDNLKHLNDQKGHK